MIPGQSQIDEMFAGAESDSGPNEASPPPADSAEYRAVTVNLSDADRAHPGATAISVAESARLSEAEENELKQVSQLQADLSAAMDSLSKSEGEVKSLWERLEAIGGKLKQMMSYMESSLGHRAHETFHCNTYQEKGNVAATVTCTSCGTETWWGWWPAAQ